MKKLFLFTFVFVFLANHAFAFSFKKKQEIIPPKMVETKEEWINEAQNLPLEEREQPSFKIPQSDKKYYYPEPNYKFEKYNYPQGKREVNIENVKRDTLSYPYFVADINCKLIAYPRYYYNPENNQISSEFFVEKLDSTKTKARRIIEYNHNQKIRKPIIQAGIKEYYPNLYSGLTLVDWSHDSKKLLIKEKTGSTQRGIYKTYLYIHIIGSDIENSKTFKLTDFDNAIKNYFLDWQNLQLVRYRYDIEPLGFSADNDDLIIVLCYVYDKDNNKIFLGTWGYDCKKRKTMLISKTNPSQELSTNGLILKQSLE